jgi:uncharacterized protein (DUF1015 family)
MSDFDFSPYGIAVPDILIPSPQVDVKAWAVVACDQYTQDPSYWEKAEKARQGKPSTLSLILPEAFLAQKDSRLPAIHQAMRDYLGGGVFAPPLHGFVYLERKTEFGRLRKGLVVAIDLDAYDWNPQKKALIRATEATIVERIPPRMDVRRGAPLESPHVMLLADDSAHRLEEACASLARSAPPAYDTDLMLGAGHLRGYALSGAALATVGKALASTAGPGFFFAVGDGNHSLASAKAVWDEYKAAHPGVTEHPARYALAEIVNIYDEGLTFEPIHRVLFNVNARDLIGFLAEKLGGKPEAASSKEDCVKRVEQSASAFCFAWKTAGGDADYALLESPVQGLAVSALQPALDEFLASRPGSSIDYIHGTEEVFSLARKEGAVSVLLPPIAKDSFFSTISAKGALPRKSFSMGEASEKRFYFECRKLF